MKIEKIKTKCSQCGTYLERHPCRMRRSKNMFCSYECKDIWNKGKTKGHAVGFKVKENNCWEWLNYKSKEGYGKINTFGNVKYAHRYFYEQKYGDIPQGLQLDHLCKNRACVNPEHLEAVSAKVNVRRGLLAKLTDTQVSTIKRMHSLGFNQTIIGKFFKVHSSHISKIVNNKIRNG